MKFFAILKIFFHNKIREIADFIRNPFFEALQAIVLVLALAAGTTAVFLGVSYLTGIAAVALTGYTSMHRLELGIYLTILIPVAGWILYKFVNWLIWNWQIAVQEVERTYPE